MSPAPGGVTKVLPQAPDPLGLSDLAPARTEASPPNVPNIDNSADNDSEPTLNPPTATTPTAHHRAPTSGLRPEPASSPQPTTN